MRRVRSDRNKSPESNAGMEAGMEAGMQKGKLEGKLEIAKKMLSEGILDKEMIANITELDLSEIEKLAN